MTAQRSGPNLAVVFVFSEEMLHHVWKIWKDLSTIGGVCHPVSFSISQDDRKENLDNGQRFRLLLNGPVTVFIWDITIYVHQSCTFLTQRTQFQEVFWDNCKSSSQGLPIQQGAYIHLVLVFPHTEKQSLRNGRIIVVKNTLYQPCFIILAQTSLSGNWPLRLQESWQKNVISRIILIFRWESTH